MLWTLVLLCIVNAQELGPRGRRLPPALRRPPFPRAVGRMPTPQPDSGASYYQNGYQGYPQGQGFQEGYREAQSASTTFPGGQTQQFQSGSTSQSSSSSGQTTESGSTSGTGSGSSSSRTVSSSSSSQLSQPSATVFTQPSSTLTQSPQSTFPQSGQTTLVSSTGSSTFPSSSGKSSSSSSSSSAFPQSSTSQPVQFPSSPFPSSSQSSLPSQSSQSNQPLVGQPLSSQSSSSLPGQPTSGISGQPISGQPISGQPISGQPISGQPISGQPISGQPISGQPISGQPISGLPLSGQPISGQPISGQPLSVQPLAPQSSVSPLPSQPLASSNPPPPAPTPAPFIPPYVPKDYDMRGCYTDTTWCPTSMSCVSSAFFNISCPNYRDPIYLNSINLECSAEAQAMWARLNFSGSKSPPQPPYLSSWQDSPFKAILLDFISRVTNPALDSYVPRDQRIACFDNDGSVWTEQPMLPQTAFLLWFVKRFPDPGQVLQNQLAGYLDGTTRGDPMSAVLSGLSVDMYNDFIRIWAEETKHPIFSRSYTDLVYAPMVDLMNLMQAACFNVFIVSGGENLFMRALIPKIYGIPASNIIGSFMELRYEEATTGSGMEFKIYPRTPVVVDRALKPVAIQRNIGRQPIFAFGNSDGDFEMLQYTTDGPGVRLGCLLRHDDNAREVAYDGHLTRSIEAAPGNGWLFSSMKKDFKDVFFYNKQPANVIYMPRPRTAAPTIAPTVPRAVPYVRPLTPGLPTTLQPGTANPVVLTPITTPVLPSVATSPLPFMNSSAIVISSSLPLASMPSSSVSTSTSASGSLSSSSIGVRPVASPPTPQR